MRARLTLGKYIGLGLEIIVSIYGYAYIFTVPSSLQAALGLCLTASSHSDLPDPHELHK